MNILKSLIAAAALSLAVMPAIGSAEAAPFKLKAPHMKPMPHPHPAPGPKGKGFGGHRVNGGAIAAGVIGALALGAIVASTARPAPVAVEGECYQVRRKVWSEEFGAFVVRRQTVCE